MNKTIKERIRKSAKKLYMIRSLGGCCENCGDDRFYVLHFHHTKEDKEFNFCGKFSTRISTLKSEADKCVLLCANCHQKHHLKNKSIKKNKYESKKILMEYMNQCKCQKCLEDNIRILNFHHTKDKKLLISDAINNSHFKTIDDIPEILKLEVDKCVILCPNCHLEEHHDHEFYETYKDIILDKSYKLKEIQKPLDRERIKQMFLDGMKQIEIAKFFNASKGTINEILKSFGLTTPIENILVDKREIIKLNINGKTNNEIKNILDCSNSCIQNTLKDSNLKGNKNPERNKSRRKFDPTPEELYKLLETNSYADLGKLFGVSRIAVFNRKKKFDKLLNKI